MSQPLPWPNEFSYIVVCSDSSIGEFESLAAAEFFLAYCHKIDGDDGAYLIDNRPDGAR